MRQRVMILRIKSKATILLGLLGKCSLHNRSYNPDLGIVAVLALLRGLLPAWYFTEDLAPVWEFTKLIYMASFVNFES